MTAGELTGVVEAAQRLAGVVAARERGDVAGARELLVSLDDPGEVAAGAVLLAELSLGLVSRATDEPLASCVGELCVALMAIPR